MKRTPLENKVTDIIEPVVADFGLALVCVRIIGEGGSRNVQIMAEDPATRRLDIDKCASLSKAVSAVLDVEDPIDGAYRLEVSSPGIDRPLVRLEDFETYAGHVAKLETAMPNENGQKKFRGTLKGVSGEKIAIDTDQGALEIEYGALVKAKLVLTDELIKSASGH
jgi:ribosome maturation factor RimP